MIRVLEVKAGEFVRLSGNPTLTSLDGKERASLRTILHLGRQADFGVYDAEQFSAPEGKQIVEGSTEAFVREKDGSIRQVFPVEDKPTPEPLPEPEPEPVLTKREMLDRMLGDYGLTVSDLKAALSETSTETR